MVIQNHRKNVMMTMMRRRKSLKITRQFLLTILTPGFYRNAGLLPNILGGTGTAVLYLQKSQSGCDHTPRLSTMI